MVPQPLRIIGGLDSGLVALVLDDARRLVGEVGLEIELPALLKELAAHPGVTVKGNRACYSEELFERARKQVPDEDTNYASSKLGDERFRVVGPFSPFEVIDFETGAKRPAEERDLVEGARLYDALGVAGPVHVNLGSLDPRVQPIRIAKLCAENSRAVGNWSPAFSYEQAVCIRDMFLAAGRPEPHVAFQMTHSPLRLDSYSLDILMRLRKSDSGLKGITAGGGAMPLAGVSAPIYWRAAAAQGLAECIGGWITAKLIDPAIHPYASFQTWCPDLATCKWTQATPEAIGFDLLTRALMREALGLNLYAACGNVDRMTLSALSGARIFECAGEREERFSLAHVAVDLEKVNFVAAALGGTGIPACHSGDRQECLSHQPGLATRIVKETFPETSFLAHESTASYRDVLWQPAVFEGKGAVQVAEMLRADSPELLPASREFARRKIAGNDFALPRDVAREVERIYDRGIRAVEAQ